MPHSEIEPSFIRLKSKMHHTIGTDSLEEAMTHLEELKQKIEIPETNIWLDPKEWNGEKGIIWIVPKW